MAKREPFHNEPVRRTLIHTPREGHPRYHAAKRAKVQPDWEAHQERVTGSMVNRVILLAVLVMVMFGCILCGIAFGPL